MSDAVRDRIAVLQHKRRQSDVYVALSSISDELGEARHAPVDPSLSFRVQSNLYAHLKAMRAGLGLRSARYTTADDAVDEFLAHAPAKASDAICELYTGSRGSGFFSGPLSQAFFLSCLAKGYEGFALVQPDLASGVLLDVARDDPTRGDFYEVEWW